jgi:predicted nucleotidyltransferase
MKFFRLEKTLLFENKPINRPIQQLDEIDALASTIDDNISKEANIPKDVLNSFKIKDNLNQDIWSEDKLNPKIKKKLINIAKDFLKDIELPKGIKINDIIFTGSLANYNWSKFSDIDLHIVIDFKQFEADEKMVEDYFYAQKSIWNQEHDITVFDYPVELYVQDVNHELVANAVYSVLRDKWLKKPKREEFDVDRKAIKDSAEKYIHYLKDIRQDYKDKHYQKVVDKVTKLKNKIKNMRKAGLESGGEYSHENLVFKVLRRTQFMDILDSFKSKAYDNLMSISEPMK